MISRQLNRFRQLALEIIRLVLRKRRRIRVSGDSMKPAFADGELVLIEPVGEHAFLDVGDAVVARHSFKNVDVIKFVASIDTTTADRRDHLIELRSPGGDDSRQFGRIPRRTVKGRVTLNLSQRTFPGDWPR